ncbi:MAG: DNA translocase FtsK [Anaerolineales bacterium]|nr:DNA translocase FtsK [Anaerolineales bacterium]
MPARRETSSKAKSPPPPADDHSDVLTSLLARLHRYGWDIAGVLALAGATMSGLGLALPQMAGGVLRWWTDLLRLWLGWGGAWVAIALAAGGIRMLRQRQGEALRLPWGRIFALEAAAFASLACLSALGGTSLLRAEAGLDGGRIGWALSYLIAKLFEPVGLDGSLFQGVLTGILFVLAMIPGVGLTGRVRRWLEEQAERGREAGPAVSISPVAKGGVTEAASAASRKRATRLPAEFRKKLPFPPEDEGEIRPKAPAQRDERLPGLDLLVNETATRPDERNINLTAGLIEKTLAEFGISAKVVGFRMGPTVTQFAVEPGFLEKTNGEGEARQKVRVAQISALSRDLALALSAERLRIEAPVPGRPYVGIEVPNLRSTVVRLRPILETEAFYKVGSPLAIGLGRDVSGQAVVADLANMPHLLIAGTTGSGKSVCIAAITTCLVMNNTPEDLRLVMIDPKMVELVRFNGLPHLYGNVETSLERILGVLRWVVSEMDLRYRELEATHSRNLDSYNRKARRRKEATLPHIVVIIDELADLMISAPEQTEAALVRLAQMARATGIHLVLATQRPSTDVVTGLIKANFPARISFAVASSVDSRVILDTVGAETLLGKGDMLFLPPESSTPQRVQGVMVSDQEVEKVITFWQRGREQGAAEPPPWEEMLKEEAMLSENDELVGEAIRIVRQTGHASASLLQRRLRIGYPRAARLIDELERMGIVGPAMGGGKERAVLEEE